MISSSLLMASFGFMINSVSPAMANKSKDNFNGNSIYKLVPTNTDGSINVNLSDEQLDKIIPKNADGSINVKIDPNEIMDVNIEYIRGHKAGFSISDDGDWVGLDVVPCTINGYAVHN